MRATIALIALVLALPGAASAQCSTTRSTCTFIGTFVQVDGKAAERVRGISGGAAIRAVESGPMDVDGTVSKQLSQDLTYEDFTLKFNTINAGLVDLIDAFLDGRRPTVDVITADEKGAEQSRDRITNAEVLSIATLFNQDMKECDFRVVIRVGTLRSPSPTNAIFAEPRVKACDALSAVVTLDGVVVPASGMDSIVLRSGGAGGASSHANPIVTVARTWMTPLNTWYQNFVVNGQNSDAFERKMSVAFSSLGASPAAQLQLDASGVGLVRRRPVIEGASQAIVAFEFEVYVERWNRKGHSPALAPVSLSAVATSPTGAGSGPADAAAGRFSARLPSGAITGTGTLCAIANDMSSVVIQLSGPSGVGIISTQMKLRVGTFKVANEGDDVVHVAFSRSGAPNAITANRGTFTLTKLGAKSSGTFDVIADVVDSTNVAREVAVKGSFTDLPKRC